MLEFSENEGPFGMYPTQITGRFVPESYDKPYVTMFKKPPCRDNWVGGGLERELSV